MNTANCFAWLEPVSSTETVQGLHTAKGGFAMLSLADKAGDKAGSARIRRVLAQGGQLFMAYMHATVRRLFSNEMLVLSSVNLTGREKESLLWET